MGFSSLLSTIQRTIDNIYLKEVEASKLIIYNNTQPPTHSESTMPGQVTEPDLSSTCLPRPPLPLSLLPNDEPLPPAVPHSHSFDTYTLRNGQTTLIQETVNQVNYHGLTTHPVIVTAPFGIQMDPSQHNGQIFEQNILLNASIMHIDPLCDIPAIRAGHIILTFVSSAIKTVLTSNLATPTNTNTTIDPSHIIPADPPTQFDESLAHASSDDNLNFMYPTPPASSIGYKEHTQEKISTSTLYKPILHDKSYTDKERHYNRMTLETTLAATTRDDFSYPTEPVTTSEPLSTHSERNNKLTSLYPTPPLSSPVHQPNYNKDSGYGLGTTLHDQQCETVQTNEITVQDHNVYYTDSYTLAIQPTNINAQPACATR
jgi:hypothetical protein